jgi:small multidrug resistance pump
MNLQIRSKWLIAAGAYNLIWGAVCCLTPSWQLELMGIQTSDIVILLWQCIGMIVGVYGIGYIIAAIDPKTHWPIILVGLLGKILGVSGMIWYIIQGTVPLEFGLTCCLNDLIWIPAFYRLLR